MSQNVSQRRAVEEGDLGNEVWELTESWASSLDQMERSAGPITGKFDVRRPIDREVGLLFAWLREEEDEFGGGSETTRWFSSGAPCMLGAHKKNNLLCIFSEGRGFPLGGCIITADSTIDALIVHRAFRGKGVGQSLALSAIQTLAKGSNITGDDENADGGVGNRYICIEAVPSAVSFWAHLGFRPYGQGWMKQKNQTCTPMCLEVYHRDDGESLL